MKIDIYNKNGKKTSKKVDVAKEVENAEAENLSLRRSLENCSAPAPPR